MLKKLLMIIVCFMMITVPALAGDFKIEFKRDGFSGAEHDMTYNNELWRLENVASIDLNFSRSKLGERVSYAVDVTWYTIGWAFMGNVIEFIIDGKPETFESPTKARRSVTPRGNVIETQSWIVSLDFLTRLSNAETVKVRVRGEKRNQAGKFGPENFENLKKFLELLKKHP